MSGALPDDPYRVLGVDPEADDIVIRRAFRRHARVHHPDVGGDAVVFESISEAYAVLSDPARRAGLDLQRRRGAPAAPSARSASASASPSPTRGAASGRGSARRGPTRTRGVPLRERSVRFVPAPGWDVARLTTPVHGEIPGRGLLDFAAKREERTATLADLATALRRDVPAARLVLGVDVPGGGRHDAALVAGHRALLVDVFPTPDVPHVWDGSTLRVGGRVATLPDVARAAAALERAVGGLRAEGHVLLYSPGNDGYRPVIDALGGAGSSAPPANPSRSRGVAAAFLAGAADADAVDASVLSALLALAPR